MRASNTTWRYFSKRIWHRQTSFNIWQKISNTTFVHLHFISTSLSKRRWSRSLRIFDPYSFKNSITILNLFYLQLNHTGSSLLEVKIMASPHITKTENIMICLILLRRKTNRNGSGLTPPNPGSCKSRTGYSMTSQLNLRQLNTYIRQYILLYLCFAAFATPTLICTCRNIFYWFAERKFELLWKDFRHIFQATWLNERNFSFLQRTDNYKSLLSLFSLDFLFLYDRWAPRLFLSPRVNDCGLLVKLNYALAMKTSDLDSSFRTIFFLN